MISDNQIAEIKAFYTKLRERAARIHGHEIDMLNRAETAALKVFSKPSPLATNGAKPISKPRGSRLNPDVQKAVLAAMATDVGYTVNEIADLSHAGRSQVKTALEIAMKSGAVAGDTSKRNRKYVLTTTPEAANA